MALRKNHLFVFILFLCICSVVESMCGGGDVFVVVNWWIVLFLWLMAGVGRGEICQLLFVSIVDGETCIISPPFLSRGVGVSCNCK